MKSRYIIGNHFNFVLIFSIWDKQIYPTAKLLICNRRSVVPTVLKSLCEKTQRRTINWCRCKDSLFSFIILRPWVEVYPCFQIGAWHQWDSPHPHFVQNKIYSGRNARGRGWGKETSNTPHWPVFKELITSFQFCIGQYTIQLLKMHEIGGGASF